MNKALLDGEYLADVVERLALHLYVSAVTTRRSDRSRHIDPAGSFKSCAPVTRKRYRQLARQMIDEEFGVYG